MILLLMEEILHELICSLSHYLQGFIHPRWCRISAINSRGMCGYHVIFVARTSVLCEFPGSPCVSPIFFGRKNGIGYRHPSSEPPF